MLTRSQLFGVRLKQHYIRYYRAIKSICDWTVWLYLLVPALAIFIGFYREWWGEIPSWAVTIPWDIISLVVITLIISTSKIIIFVENADQVILLQKPNWLLSLKRWGLLYCWLVLQLIVVTVLFILLPFLVLVSQWTTGQIGNLLAYMAISSVIPLIMNQRLQITAAWWKKWPLQALIYIVNIMIIVVPLFLYLEYNFSYWVSIIVYSFFALLIIRKYVISPLNFQQHLSASNESKLQFTKMILSQSVELTSTSKRKTPIFFRNSQRLTRRNNVESIVGELYMKSLLRDFGRLKVWLMFLSVSCFALTQVPGNGPFFVIILLGYIAFNLFNLQWEQWCKHDFVAIYMRQVEHQKRAMRQARNPLIALFVLIWLIVAIGLQL